ncbi:unnamed protein product [Peniophora sp. CBMAI 1063]|nr:unnamed protein product [Peniophora sp. CBMAI 1063]
MHMFLSVAPSVHRLPPELLRYIFRLVGGPESALDEHGSKPPLAYLSHVCGRWREVALDMQEMWSYWPQYNRMNDNWTQLCCSRAKTVPLVLLWQIGYGQDADGTGSTYLPHIRHTLSHVSRARDFAIRHHPDPDPASTAFWRDEALPAISIPCPLLEKFWYGSNPELSDDDLRCLKPTLFGGRCPPRLYDAHLSSCEALLSTPIYSANLLHLSLWNTRAWIDVDGMVEVFRSIPNLESFTYSLSNAYRGDFTFDCRPSGRHHLRSVPMNRIKSFRITESCFVPGITIFSYLALPPNAYISLKWDADERAQGMEPHELEDAVEHMRIGLKALNQHFMSANRDGQSPLDAVEIAGTNVRPLYHGSKDRDTDESVSGVSLYAPLIDTQQMLLRPEPCLMTALHPIFTGASYLRLTIGNAGDTTRWYALWCNLHCYSKVIDLHLCGKSVERFVEFLMIRMLPGFWENTPRLFPLLESITISDFDFTGTCNRMRPDGDERPLVQALGDAVKSVYGDQESFDAIVVGATCVGHEDAVKQFKLCLGEDRVELDDTA